MTQHEAQGPWFVDAFDERYLRAYGMYFTPEHDRIEVDGIERLTAIGARSRILDLCCGQGRHAILLASRGHTVAGLDLSEPLLRIADENARRQGVSVTFTRADVREIPFGDEFDLVISMTTSFGFLDTKEEDALVLRGMWGCVRPGGVVFMHLINRDLAMRHWKSTFVNRHDDGTVVANEKEFDLLRGRIKTHLTIVSPDGSETADLSYRVYSLTDMVELLERAGFDEVAAYGGFDGAPLTTDNDSNSMILVARKPPTGA